MYAARFLTPTLKFGRHKKKVAQNAVSAFFTSVMWGGEEGLVRVWVRVAWRVQQKVTQKFSEFSTSVVGEH